MTIKQFLGLCLVISPLIVVTTLAVRDLGWRAALEIWLIVLVTLVVIYTGLWLLLGFTS